MMEPIHSQSVPEILVQRILTDIGSGKLRAGDRLPAQRDIALQYKISNSSVREAVRTLVGMGILEVRHPVGTFVVGEPMTSSQAIRMTSPSSPKQFQEAMEARCLVEMDLNRLAAMRATVDQVSKFCQIIDNMESALRSGQADVYTEFDVSLHIAIAQSSNNRFLANYVHSLRTVIGDYLQSIPGSQADLRNHKDLIAAIQQHDIPQADTASRNLLLHVANLAVGQQLLTEEDYARISKLLQIS